MLILMEHKYPQKLIFNSWVLSSDIDSLARSTYNSLTSNTSRYQEGQTWQECYTDLSCVYGDVYTETISVGGIVVNNQTIGVAKEATSDLLEANDPGGILGLSFNKDSMGKSPSLVYLSYVFSELKGGFPGVHKYTSFWDNIKSTLSAPLFTADLKKGEPGSYDFGFIDDSKYTGNITYVSVDTTQGFWTFTVKGYAIGGEAFNPITVNVIASTGTSLILLPEQMVKTYYAGVPGAFYDSTEALFGFPCGTTLPSITFDIGNYNAVVPGHLMNYQPLLDDDNSMFYRILKLVLKIMLMKDFFLACFGGIQPALDPQSFHFGDIFLKSQFVVFDAGDEPRLGFAAKPL